MSGSCAMSSQEGGAKKRKLTPYNIFVKKMFKELCKKHSNEKAPAIMKRIGAAWQLKKNK